MKVAFVYDRVNKWGGAERVLLALHELFPDAPLYTSVYDSEQAPWAKTFAVIPSFLQKLPFAKRHHEFIPFLMPMAFESFSFDTYDLVISITSEAAKGIITRGKTKHVCYCLTPTRYLWSGYDEYFANKLFSTIAHPAIRYLKNWDTTAAQRPDAFIAISQEVQARIKKYYNRESVVIYPPVVDLRSKHYESRIRNHESGINEKEIRIKGEYFLVVSRLVPYKRVDLAVKACTASGLPLKIIGTGSEFDRLQAIAGSTVEFLGKVSDEELAMYYASCSALLFPGNEDFGLTVLEAQSFGKPVIAYRGGGAIETIMEGKTGLFFPQQTVDAMKKVLSSFDPKNFKASDCKKQAGKFGKERFKKDFLAFVESVTSR